MLLRNSLLVFLLFCAPVVLAQASGSKPEETKSKYKGLPWEDPKKVIKEATPYEMPEGSVTKRNVTHIETLFDWEHIRPFETPYDPLDPDWGYHLKDNTLLGSLSIEARAAGLFGIGSNAVDGASFFSRMRWGPVGMDFSVLELDEGKTLDSLLSFRGTLDMDFYRWLNVRLAFGYTEIGLTGNTAPGVTFGGEVELYLVEPFTVEFHLDEHATDEFSNLQTAFLGVGIVPTVLFSRTPVIYPEFRIGWRRIIGIQEANSKEDKSIGFWVFEVALEF